MNLRLKQLQHMYDEEIRKQCENTREKIFNCFNDNRFEMNSSQCEKFVLNFKKCINEYNKKFKHKYSKIVDFQIYDS